MVMALTHFRFSPPSLWLTMSNEGNEALAASHIRKPWKHADKVQRCSARSLQHPGWAYGRATLNASELL